MSSAGSCPSCGAGLGEPFLEIRDVPVECNLLSESAEAARAVPRGDIRLALCPRCGLITNSSFDPSLAQYDSRYENSLWSSPTFAAYAKALIDRLIERYDIRGKRVLGVGSGRGEFLNALCEAGDNEALGFDPSYNLEEGLPGSHVHMVPDYFRALYADIDADLVVCRHVLEHVSDPAGLARLIRHTLSDGGVAHVEVPNGAYMLRTDSVWDVIYEHPHYFVEGALTGLFRGTGFRIEHVYTGYGDQYLGLEAAPDPQPPARHELAPDEVEGLEVAAERFGSAYRTTITTWANRLATWKRAGARVAVWGMGSKGVMFLNAVPGAASIEALVDINPRKQGRYVAGTGQRIAAPHELAERDADVVIIMNPLYRQEIAGSLDALGVHADVIPAARSTAA
jgi:SAM-dependent methyltransferase